MIAFFLFTQALLVVLLVIWGASRDRRFLYLSAFLIPLMSLSIDIGVLLTWQRVLVPLAVVALIIGKRRLVFKIHGMRFLLLFLAYAVAVTIVFALSEYATGEGVQLGRALGWGEAQTTYRHWVQLGTTISLWGVALIPAWFVHSDEDLGAIINGYINGTLVSVAVGFYQVLAIRWALPGSDFDWFIGRERGLFRDMEALDTFGTQVYRLSGFSGEPKHLGAFALSALALLLVIELFAPKKFRVRRPVLKMAVLAIGILLSFSSGAWLAGLSVVAFLLLWATLSGKRTALVYGFLVGIFGLILILSLDANTILRAVQYRVIGRVDQGLTSIELYEPKDAAFVYYAIGNPQQLIIGSGAGGLDFRLIPYLYELNPAFIQRGGTATPAYFYTRFLGEFGLVGFSLIFALVIVWLKVMSRQVDYRWGRVFIVAGALALMVTSSVSLMGYVLLAASMNVLAAQSIVEPKEMEGLSGRQVRRRPFVGKNRS